MEMQLKSAILFIRTIATSTPVVQRNVLTTDYCAESRRVLI